MAGNMSCSNGIGPASNQQPWRAGQNIDVRGEGGYVIMAPSVCADEGSNNVVGPSDFFHFAVAPDWLYELVLARPEPKPKPAPDPARRQLVRLGGLREV